MKNFKSINYYSLLGDFNINNNTIKARLKTEDKILDENLAKEIKESCENQNAKINLKIENKKNIHRYLITYLFYKLNVQNFLVLALIKH
ncbi:hypothetical protein B10525_17950 (plasmid) [Campylobacter jejuni]|nr:hypothetical protein B10525_17950 [Campylobacter jejuni]